MEIVDFHSHPGYDFHIENHGVDIDMGDLNPTLLRQVLPSAAEAL